MDGYKKTNEKIRIGNRDRIVYSKGRSKYVIFNKEYTNIRSPVFSKNKKKGGALRFILSSSKKPGDIAIDDTKRIMDYNNTDELARLQDIFSSHQKISMDGYENLTYIQMNSYYDHAMNRRNELELRFKDSSNRYFTLRIVRSEIRKSFVFNNDFDVLYSVYINDSKKDSVTLTLG
ncbi:hypothetical protein GUITHDRAFT_122508 [Guillardia theta CCMP2712]|uniref:Uncharacterized protein n=1 Tax=Guillardia theta (strain CCMP2712) TaxID=905079 RepID=L1I631_GUITC|nr:hypothetical protein GUITHDRAFT_122508 [Guillardia theta CCMP2712]EKX31295.1 hypothetical protein GUITHDRAFT_122508 [Guillardia theta CCMP2712]|eukprot:XP_005818275.1 hypothetical protein GUITHDRAFT_122508 [Guillardia theta CCMP2712]